jgi:hypothetical protein
MYCKMANGDWFIMTAHMLIQPDMFSSSWQEKENGTTPSTSVPVCIVDSCDLFLFPKIKLKFKKIIQKYLQVVLNGTTKDKIQTGYF